jgi:hypothetical protein
MKQECQLISGYPGYLFQHLIYLSNGFSLQQYFILSNKSIFIHRDYWFALQLEHINSVTSKKQVYTCNIMVYNAMPKPSNHYNVTLWEYIHEDIYTIALDKLIFLNDSVKHGTMRNFVFDFFFGNYQTFKPQILSVLFIFFILK